MVLSLLPQLELCAQGLDLRYDHPSLDGYFAPRVAQLCLGLGAGCRLNLELEGCDSQSGVEATTATDWRYGFAAASQRVPMP